MDRGSLSNMQKAMQFNSVPPRMLAYITKQILRGLQYLKMKNMLHRDIKPENILHNNLGEVKLTDFGISRDLGSDVNAQSAVGTQTYMSPERVRGSEAGGYSYSSDIWSLGVLVYELATGSHPFTSERLSFPVLFFNLCEKPEPRLDPDTHPKVLCDFVACTLVRDVARRAEVDALMKHSFICTDCADQQEFAA